MAPSPPSLLLWLTLVLCAPVPFFLVETGYEPVAGLLQILAVIFTLMIREGSSGAVTIAAWIIGVQVVLALLVLALATVVTRKLLRSTFGRRATLATYVLVAVIVTVAVTQPIYRTPFRAGGLQANLGQVFE